MNIALNEYCSVKNKSIIVDSDKEINNNKLLKKKKKKKKKIVYMNIQIKNGIINI
jgi:hypothetical protein